MAIRIKSLENISNTKTQYNTLYRDLYLDLVFSKTLTNGVIYPNPIIGADIKQSQDVAAIENSLQNLFSTLPGQRFLFPEYGMNLEYYLFQPITETTASLIGNTILNKVAIYEPRVNILNINVIAQPDDNQYTITITMEIPVLNISSVQSSFVFNVKSQSFVVIQQQNNL